MAIPTFQDVNGQEQPILIFNIIIDAVNIFTLPNAPKGWDGAKINQHRSDVYWGMVRSFSGAAVSYVKDGAWLLRKSFFGSTQIGQLTEAKAQQQVLKWNAATYGYELVYQGDFNFATFKDFGLDESDQVQIEIMNAGIQKDTKAYETVNYTIEIPTSGPDSKVITCTPIILKETAQLNVQPIAPDANNGNFPIISIVTNEQKAIYASVFDNPSIIYVGSPNFATAGGYFYSAQTSGKVRFTNVVVNGFIFAPLAGSNDCEVQICSSVHGEIFDFFSQTNIPNLTPFNYTNDFTIDVVAGEHLFLYTRSNSGACYAVFQTGSWTMSYDTISPSTDIYAVTGQYLHQQLMNKMNGGAIPVPIQSYLLTGPWATLLFTSGNAIKPFVPVPLYNTDSLLPNTVYYVYVAPIKYNGVIHAVNSQFTTLNIPNFTSDDDNAYVMQVAVKPTIITNWQEFFNNVNFVTGAGWGTQIISNQETSVLEKKSYWFQPSIPAIDVGKVAKGPGTQSSISNLYSSVKYGYKDQTYDQINGVTEFNSEAESTFPIRAIQKELNLQCTYRADSTGIELLRVGLNQQAQGSSNTAGNNDTFMIYCIPGGTQFIPEPASAFGNVIGLATNLYNLRISPRENLLRHNDYLAGCLYGQIGGLITFASGYKNVNLSRIGSTGKVITENANIPISDLGLPLFIPLEFNITTAEPIDMLSLLDLNPQRTIQFTCTGVDGDMTASGFVLDTNCDIAFRTPQDLKLLCAPGVDIRIFVR